MGATVGYEAILVVVDSTFRFEGGDTSLLELAVLFMIKIDEGLWVIRKTILPQGSFAPVENLGGVYINY